MSMFIKLDARKRVSLAKFSVNPGDVFIVHKEPTGRIILEPAKIVLKNDLDAEIVGDLG